MLSHRWLRNVPALFVGMSLVLGLTCLSPPSARAGDKAVATCASVRGALLSRSGDQDWATVNPRDPIKGGALLVSLFEAHLVSANKAVKVELFGDVGAHGDFPVMEAAARIQENPGADLDLTLLRGSVALTNQKPGAARIVLHILKDDVTVTLKGPGAKVALTLTSRHAPGASSIARDNPATFLFAIVLKGSAVFAGKKEQLTLKAPPGPAMLTWDSIDHKPEVMNLPEAPPEPNEAEKAEFKKMCMAAGKFNEMTPIDAAMNLARSPQEIDRQVGVTALGALDALPQLLVTINDPKHADVGRQSILVLRHWVGREPGQIKKFEKVLIAEKNLSAAKVKSAVSLLLGFDEAERAQGTTYDFLIDCLAHKSVAVGELAHWHLVRLAPAGKSIPFDAAAPAEERQQAVERWRALIPPGQVPRPPKTKSGNPR
jgi:hypothetical protein